MAEPAAPGEQFAYSNFGTSLLAVVLAKVGGASFEELCKIHIFEPLGMSSTSWFMGADYARRAAMPYSVDLSDYGYDEDSAEQPSSGTLLATGNHNAEVGRWSDRSRHHHHHHHHLHHGGGEDYYDDYAYSNDEDHYDGYEYGPILRTRRRRVVTRTTTTSTMMTSTTQTSTMMPAPAPAGGEGRGYCFIDYPSGSLRSSATDLAKYLSALANRGAIRDSQRGNANEQRLFSETTSRQLSACQQPEASIGKYGPNDQGGAENCTIGFSWFLTASEPPDFSAESGFTGDLITALRQGSGMFHDGSETGVGTIMLVLPEANFAMGVLTNADGGEELWQTVARTLVPSRGNRV